jgi:choline dehydrogenase-like flavoprotein
VLADFRELEPGRTLSADVCVVGCGAAGITIARELANSRTSVIVLESGGLQFDPAIQSLYAGTQVPDYFALDASRFRLLGGTTLVWGGWCAPLQELDFERRDWVRHSGWPIGLAELLPYYRRAQAYCQLGRYRYEIGEWPTVAKEALDLDPARLAHRIWQLSPPTRFGETYIAELTSAANLHVLLHATAVELVSDESATAVTGVRIRDLGGRTATVRARVYIVACGGIETTRLLLASRGVEEAGIGNRHDVLGRYFMEHPHPDAGAVVVTGDAGRLRAYVGRRTGNEQRVVGFGPSRTAQARHGILNSSIAIGDATRGDPSDGLASLLTISRSFEARRWPESLGSHVMNMLRDLDDLFSEAWHRSTDGEVRGYFLTARTEIAPDPANRITLDRELDALGMNRVRLEWKASRLDRVSVATTMRLLAEEFGRLGVGRIRVNELLYEDDGRWLENLSWFGHHMGTTRMSRSPGTGYVDADCRVHGIGNLYIAGASVFPTSGYANPTLTVLALTLRLVDHVRGTVLARGSV